MNKKVYYHHTDCGGIVYYGKYLEFLEEARTEFFDEKGLSLKELRAQGIQFVVYRQEIDYKAPAFYGDMLQIKTWVGSISDVSIEFQYEIKNQAGKLVSKAKTTVVCINKNLEPQSIPDKVRSRIPVQPTVVKRT